MNENLTLNTYDEVLQYLRGTDRPILVSVSGGKDSTAVALLLMEQQIQFTPIFCDTGWEHKWTYDYINTKLQPKIGEIKVLKNESLNSEPATYGMINAVIKKKGFPNGRMKWCTNELKLVGYRAYAVEVFLKTGKFPINITGIRKEESHRRSQFPYVEEQDEATQIRPILEWTTQDVIDIHLRNNLTPNPLYLKGATRVGCWPCIYANKSDIRLMADLDPERIDFLEDLENKSEELFGRKATFFKRGGIREAVSWSRGKTDGVYSLFTDGELGESDVGCFRWGLCESNPENKGE